MVRLAIAVLVAELLFHLVNKIRLLLFKWNLRSLILYCSQTGRLGGLLYLEVSPVVRVHILRRRSRSLHGLLVRALWTDVLKYWFILSFWIWDLGVDSGQNKLHLEVVRQILESLNLALEAFDEVLHVSTVEALLLLLIWSRGSDWKFNSWGSFKR